MPKQSIDERRSMKILLGQAKALEETMQQVINHDEKTAFKYVACNDFVRAYQELADASTSYIHFSAPYHSYDLEKLKNPYDMIALEQQALFQSVFFSVKMLIVNLQAYFDFASDETDNLENLIFKRFRSLFRDAPINEKEVQNTLENLFISNGMDKGIDYDRETGKFNFSGREYIPDFIIPKLRLCIEVKLLKDAARKSKIIEEINADITAYGKQYERILFVVYDIGCIRDEIEFKRDIEASGDIKLLLIKH
ncbi:MAG: hypothetical protein VB039_01890 [Oscillospiraceae bacterium]|nr:hypothetical protein [Oscillospiraceae bacterium]